MSKTAHSHLLNASKRTDSKLHYVIRKHGVIHLEKAADPDIFVFLARTLIGQQLSKSVAETIWGKFSKKADELSLSLCKLCQDDYYGEIRACGVSNSKTKALLLLRQAHVNSHITDKAILKGDYQDIFESVTSLWGFGRWSADMVAIFYSRLPDILPQNDVAVRRGLTQLVETHTEESLYESFSPYRSYLCLHLWKALDSGLVQELVAKKTIGETISR